MDKNLKRLSVYPYELLLWQTLLSILLAVTALLSEPNTRDLSLDPRHQCLRDGGVIDMIILTDLADLAPVVVNSMLLFAFISGDWVETTCLVFNLSFGVLLTGILSFRTFCYLNGIGDEDLSEIYPKPYDLFFLVFLEALMVILHFSSFCLILANRPGPGTSSEMIIEPLLKLWKRRTFKYIFIKLVPVLTLSFLIRFGSKPFLIPEVTRTGNLIAHLSPHTEPAIRKLIALGVTLQPFVLMATLVGEFRDDRLVVFCLTNYLVSFVLYSALGYVYLSSEIVSRSPVRPEGIAAGGTSFAIAALNVFLFYRVNSYKFNRKKDGLL